MYHTFSDTFFANFLPVSENEFRWGIYLTGAGYESSGVQQAIFHKQLPKIYHMHPYQGRILPEYVFFHITHGSGSIFSSKTAPIHVKTGAFGILYPGIRHNLIPDSTEGWSVSWFTCNGTFFHHLIRQKILDPTIPIVYRSPKITQRGKRIIEKMVSKVKKKPFQNTVQYSTDILSFLTCIFYKKNFTFPHDKTRNDRPGVPLYKYHHSQKKTENENPPPRSPLQIAQAARQKIWNWGHYEINISLLADQLKITRRTLERYFKKHLHCTIRDEIHRCRLFRACNLLQETSINIEQISLMAGFPNYTHMNRVFQRYLHISPSDFRKKNKKG
ncbi:MAG: helix-turn-helix transcriptional regulator [Planctomycetia bacterium]|nr:helix-turn-helix transcriptional regulator [Planctomycetia bacterium]